MKFGGIDWDNRHPETLDIEPGSCEYWIQMDKHYGTTSDSPLAHEAKHYDHNNGCKPMARVEMKDIDRIESFVGYVSGKHHTAVYFMNDPQWTCSCQYNKDYDNETGDVPRM